MWLRKSLRTKTAVRQSSDRRTGSLAKRLTRSRRLQLEPLEQRAMLTDYTMSATQNGSADTFSLKLSGSNVLGYVNGALNQTMPLATLGKITVNGSNDNDTLTIDSSGGAFAVPNGVTFNAGSGTDVLVTQSQTSNGDIMNVTPTASGAGTVAYIAADGTENNLPIVTYSGVDSITLTGQAGTGDTFAIDGSTGNDAFTVNEGASAGAGTVTATLNGAAYNLPTVTFTGMQVNSECLINSSSLTNGGGRDTLTFNGTSSADTMTVSPAFLNGMFIAANTGGDRLKVRADNMSQINLNSSGGNDTINMSGGINAPMAIDTGAGTDAIHLSNSPDPDTRIYTVGKVVDKFGTDRVTYVNAESIDGATTIASTLPPADSPIFWIDASTLSLSVGAAVTSVSDLSGYNNNLTAVGTGGTFKINALNGKGTIHFSGGVNCLQTVNNLGLLGDVSRTVIAVMRYNGTGGARMKIHIGGFGTNEAFGIEENSNFNHVPYLWNNDLPGNIQPADTFRSYVATHELNGLTTGYTSGALQGTVGGTIATRDYKLIIAQSDNGYMDGDLAELLVYNRTLTSTERAAVESYLNAKWFSNNVAPTLNAISNPAAIGEGAGQQTINLSGITAGASESQALQVTAVSDDTGLIPNPTVTYTSPQSTGSIAYTPVPYTSGTANITVTVRDAGPDAVAGNSDDATFSQTFTVTVNAGNQTPTLDTIANPATINVNAGQQTINLTGISAGPGDSQALQVTATSDNTGLIPNPSVNYTSPGVSGSISYTPVTNQSGTAHVTVTVRDAGLDGVMNNGDDATIARSFTVVVQAGNATPTLDSIADPAAINMNAGQQTINLTGITAGGLESQTLQVTATSDLTGLIPNPTVTYTSPQSTGSIRYTPVTNQSGAAHVTVTVRDAGLDGTMGNGDDATFSRTFTVVVNNPAGLPSGIICQLDASTLGLANGAAISSVTDASGSGHNVSAYDANNKPTYVSSGLNSKGVIHFAGGTQGLLGVNNIGISGNASRTMFVVARKNDPTNGRMTIAIGNTTNYGGFGLDAHTSDTTYVPFTVGTGGVETSARTNGVYETFEMIHDGTANYNYGYMNGTSVGSASSGLGTVDTPLKIGYWSDAGVSSIGDLAEIIIFNRALSTTERQQVETYLNNKWFSNHTPTLNNISDPAPISAGAGQQNVSISGITDGDSNLQTLQITVSSDNVGLIANPQVTATRPNGTVSYTPVAGQGGTAHLSVTVKDAGLDGIMGNGDDLSVVKTFTVIVNNPTGLPSGVICQLDASTLGLANGAVVSTLTDSSGSGHSVSAYDTNNKPTYIASGLNGKGVIHFNGGTQGLLGVNNIGISGDASRTVFVVARKNDPTNGRMTIAMGNTTSYGGFGLDAHTSDTTYVPFTVGTGGVETAARTNGVFETFEMVHDGSTHYNYGYMNGALVGSSSSTLGTVDTPLKIGYWQDAGVSSVGDLAEIIVFNRVLSTAERQQVEAYLNNKWMVALPSGIQMRIDASQLGLTNGAQISTITDISGSGHNLQATDTNNKPTFYSNGPNGQGVIHFNGGTQGLIGTNNLGLAGNSSQQIFVVMRKNNPTSGRMIVANGIPSDSGGFGIDSHASDAAYVPFTSSAGSVVGAARSNAAYELYDVSHNATTNVNIGYINGTVFGTSTYSLSITDGPLKIGYWSNVPASSIGDLAEIIVYNRVLSDAERQQVEEYLTEKWLPALPSGITMRIDASALNMSDGSAISTITDLSGAGHDMQAYDTNNKPTLNWNGLNGKSTIHFNGGTQGLIGTNNLGLAGDSSQQIFVVMRKNNPTTGRMIVANGTDPGNSASFGIDSHTTGEIYMPFVAGQGSLTLAARSNATFEVYDVSRNSATDENKGYINGTLMGTTTSGLAVVDAPLKIGYWSQVPASSVGDVAEIIVYNRVLTDAERQTVDNYLVQKWLSGTDPTIRLPELTVNAGEQVTAPLTTDGAVGMKRFTVTITYDPKLVSVTNADIKKGSLLGAGWTITPDVANGVIRVSAEGVDVIDNNNPGNLLDITYHALKGVTGVSTLGINTAESVFYEANGSIMPLDPHNGAITITAKKEKLIARDRFMMNDTALMSVLSDLVPANALKTEFSKSKPESTANNVPTVMTADAFVQATNAKKAGLVSRFTLRQ